MTNSLKRQEKRTRLAKYQKHCHLCGEPLDISLPLGHHDYVNLDHIIPRSKGGGESLDNLHLSHMRCNSRKGNDNPVGEAIEALNERPLTPARTQTGGVNFDDSEEQYVAGGPPRPKGGPYR